MEGHVCGLLDRPASRKRRAAAAPAGKHVNFVKGMDRAMRRGAQGSNAAVNTLRVPQLRVTVQNFPQLKKDATVHSRLLEAARRAQGVLDRKRPQQRDLPRRCGAADGQPNQAAGA